MLFLKIHTQNVSGKTISERESGSESDFKNIFHYAEQISCKDRTSIMTT